MSEFIIGLDTDLLLWINSRHSPFWDIFMYTTSGRLVWIPFYAMILYAIYRSYGFRTMLVMGAMAALAITAADQLCASVIRPAFERLRPSNLNNPVSEFVHIVNGYRGGRYGFPSCHAANTFAIAALTSCLFRRWRYTLSVMLWAATVSYSRIYLGVHYPGDILVGLTVGLICGTLCYCAIGILARFFTRFKPTEKEARTILDTYRRDVPEIRTTVMGEEFRWLPSALPPAMFLLTAAAIMIYSQVSV